ncbi:MAG: hypothetical protein EBX41_05700 [Chitinophagia bacterium]|nr:hypothetical protein [Chitinophagia bacterium]
MYTKRLTTLLLLIFITPCLKAQTLCLRSQSVNSMDIVLKGVDRDGHSFYKTLYNVYAGFNKTYSINEMIYCHELYRKDYMEQMGYDTSAHWESILVYNQSLLRHDSLNITHKAKHAYLPHANVRAKVTITTERKHSITEVILTDEEE